MEEVVNKVVITEEAQSDYESMFHRQMPKTDIKHEAEDFLENIRGSLFGYYLRAKYLDESLDRMLMLFFYKGKRFGRMQMWELKGVCRAEDWSELLEEEGQIRAWLNSPLEPEDDGDWVCDLRVAMERAQAERRDYDDEN